jgi:hypothetical protein
MVISNEEITMKVTVFHKDFDSNSFTRVAVVNANTTDESRALEYAYRWTQNIMDSWSLKMECDGNDDVEVVGELPVHDGQTYGLRSSMMGDRFYVEGGDAYECAMVGFEALPVLEDV